MVVMHNTHSLKHLHTLCVSAGAETTTTHSANKNAFQGSLAVFCPSFTFNWETEREKERRRRYSFIQSLLFIAHQVLIQSFQTNPQIRWWMNFSKQSIYQPQWWIISILLNYSIILPVSNINSTVVVLVVCCVTVRIVHCQQ